MIIDIACLIWGIICIAMAAAPPHDNVTVDITLAAGGGWIFGIAITHIVDRIFGAKK